MKKNKFLALTMLCSVLSGVSANAQEVKNSGSQTTGEVKNSSGNKGTSNSDKNVEKITKKAPNSKKVEGGNSSGSKKSDVKKGDKEVTKDKAKDSGEVGWEDFKKRFGDGVSSFVDLVKRHPVWSSIIGIGGGITIGEGVRRTCFKQKNNNPHKPEGPPNVPVGPHVPVGPQPHGPVIPLHGPGGPQPHGPGMPPPQPVKIWGVNKFGYKGDEDCIYRNPNKGKIKVILVGSRIVLDGIDSGIIKNKNKNNNNNNNNNNKNKNKKKNKKKSFEGDFKSQLVDKLKSNNSSAPDCLKVNEDEIKFKNLEIERVYFSGDGKLENEESILKLKDEIIKKSKNGANFLVFAYRGEKNECLSKLTQDINLKVSKLVVGKSQYDNVNCCNKLEFQLEGNK